MTAGLADFATELSPTAAHPPLRDNLDGLQAAKRLRILNRATLAFVNHGYAGANLEDIAIAAGVSKVTIYRFFPDKAALFEAAVTSATQEMAQSLGDLLPLDLPIHQALEQFACHFIERMMRPVVPDCPFYHLARVLVGATQSHVQLGNSCIDIFQRNIAVPLSQYFAEKISLGELSDASPQFLASHFTQMLFFTNAVAMQPELLPRVEAVPRLAREKVQLFLYGAAGAGSSHRIGPHETLPAQASKPSA